MKKINELRDYLLENYVDRDGDLDISDLDFSKFDGDIIINRMKVKCNLSQSSHEVKGNLSQSYHEVMGNLSQSFHEVMGRLHQSFHEVMGSLHQSNHKVDGNLSQSRHDVDGDYDSTNINVTGTIKFEEPKKLLKEITVEELEKMGYKIKEKE